MIIRLDSREPMPADLRGAIMALGNFDGFHRGHQAVVGEALRWAKVEGRPAIVATFDPHPVRFFVPDCEPFRLTDLAQREELFAQAGADAILIFHFDAAMAACQAQDWVQQVIGTKIGVAGVVTGIDFTFGHQRSGNAAVLERIGAEAGFAARALAPITEGGEVISSSRIREALKAGDTAGAKLLLTRPFAVRAMVQPGAQIGRNIGFPTANMILGDYQRPAYGIYAVRAKVMSGEYAGHNLEGVANFGIRPMFEPAHELLEPHFFDFSGDLYGADIEVSFEHFLRPEEKFDSLEALTAQIQRDCDAARKLLSARA